VGHNARVLPGEQMRRLEYPTWEEILAGSEMRFVDPNCDRLSSLLGNLELHWPVVRLVVHNHGAWQDRPALGNIQNAEA
jgi:hypothetical protein